MDIIGYKSVSSRFGQLTEQIFDEYPIYRFPIESILIDEYFPSKLSSFPTKTMKSLTKRYLFYSKPTVTVTRYQCKDPEKYISNSITFADFLDELSKDSNSTKRFNFIILDDCLLFIQVPSVRHISYYALCKHIILSNRAKYVRFAGEIWSDDDKQIFLNNNSGTYRPPDQLIAQAVTFFHFLSPNLYIQGLSRRISSLPSIKRRFWKKIHTRVAI